MDVRVIDHPLAAVRLSALRDEKTDDATFRAALADLATMLIYEATRDLERIEYPVTTPVTETVGHRLARSPLLVPVLRAGLGMLGGAQSLLPLSRTGFIGVARDEHTHLADEYLVSLPDDLSGTPVLVLDPMLATGGSMADALRRLAERGATDVTAVCVVCAPQGIEAMRAIEQAGVGRLRLITATIDDGLNDAKFIVPGLGDAGDRQFGPR